MPNSNEDQASRDFADMFRDALGKGETGRVLRRLGGGHPDHFESGGRMDPDNPPVTRATDPSQGHGGPGSVPRSGSDEFRELMRGVIDKPRTNIFGMKLDNPDDWTNEGR